MAERKFTSASRLAKCRCVDEVKRTIAGLAMTPAQVAELTARGIPVSTKGMQEYYDESPNPMSFTVEPMFKRGADINQLWELEKDAQSKFLSARKYDIKRNGY